MHGTVTVVWDIIHPSDLWSLSSILLRGRSQFGGLYSPCRSLTGVGVCVRPGGVPKHSPNHQTPHPASHTGLLAAGLTGWLA